MNPFLPPRLPVLMVFAWLAGSGYAQNLLVNGGFENPPGIFPYSAFGVGESPPGWTVENGTVEITAGTYWQAAEGAQSLDLNGIFDSIGTIYQDVPTTPGAQYRIRFAYAGNPECGLPTLKTADVFWSGGLLTTLVFDITGYNNTNLGWRYYEQIVTATSPSTRLRFQATSPTFCGMTLDDVSVVPVSVGECVPVPPGLVAWWPADGFVTDATGSLDGTALGTTAFAPGVGGEAFDFAGGSWQLRLPDRGRFRLDGSLTIEGWIFVRAPGGTVVARGDKNGTVAYGLRIDSRGRLAFRVASPTDAVELLAPIATHAWRHVAAVLDGESGSLRLFINGALVAEASTTLRPVGNLNPEDDPALVIGGNAAAESFQGFNGLVDELALYNRALPRSEFKALYAATNSGKCSLALPPQIISQPTDQEVQAADDTIMTVVAQGSPPLFFQWQFQGENLQGQSGDQLFLSNLSPADAGSYAVVISNAFGTITSSNAWLTVTSPPGPSTCLPPPAGLVAWWRAEDTALDTINGNRGVLSNGASYATGSTGRGFHFPGPGSHIRVPASPSLNVGLSNGLTLECWIKPADLAEAQPLLEWNAGSIMGVQMWISEPWWAGQGGPGSVFANITDTGGGTHALISSPHLLNTNAFQHVAVTYDKASGQGKLYLNGDVVFDVHLGQFTPETSTDLLLGQRPPASPHPANYQGVMDEVSIYNRALSQAEIRAIVTARGHGKCHPTNPPSLAGVPVITSFHPTGAKSGDVVTLSGTNFSPVAASNIAFFGAVRAAVTTATTTSLSVIAPPGATYSPITVNVGGLVAYSRQPFQPTFPGNPTNVITTASFAPRFDLAAGDGAHRSAIADLDGDGRPDIAVADVYGHTISLFRNLGTTGQLSASSFAPRFVLPAVGGNSDNPYGFMTADVDGDGKLDLVACDRLGNHVSVYRNLASPGRLETSSFAPYVNFPVGADPRYAHVADLDGDGRPDIVSANYAANTVSILRNVGQAGSLGINSFAPAVHLPAGAGPYDVTVGDLDGDGKPDLAVVCTDGPTLSLYRNVSAPGTLNAASFAPRVDFEALAGNDTLALGDVDGDGKTDIVFGSFLSRTLSVYRNQASPGPFTAGSLGLRVDFATGNWTHNVALADLNGDGRTDIASVGELDSYLSVFHNLGTPGNFTSSSLGARVDFGAGWNAWGISIGDLDGDQRPDIVFCNAYDDTVSVYRNLSDVTNLPPPLGTNCIAAPAGMASWWRGEGNALDTQSTNHGALPLGMHYAMGEVGQAFAFDGTNGVIAVPASASLNVGLGTGLTIEAWIKPASTELERPIVEWNSITGGNPYPHGVHFWISVPADHGGGPGCLFANLVDTEGNFHWLASSSGVIQTNSFQHVAVTYERNSGLATLLVNGTVVAEQNLGSFTPQTSFNMYLGHRPAGEAQALHWAGLMDEVALYARALSQSEIQAIYAAGSLGKCTAPAPPSPTNCLAAPVGLVGWWQAQSNAVDATGGAPGDFAAAAFEAGKVGAAFAFDAASHVVVPDQPALNPTNALTIECWVLPRALTTWYAQDLVSKDAEFSGPRQYLLSLGPPPGLDNGTGGFRAHVGVPSGFHFIDGVTTVQLGIWYHVAMTYDGAMLRLYVNGQLDAQLAVTGNLLTTSEPLRLGGGAPADDPPYFFAGLLDEVSLYGRALSQSEIQAIYAAGSMGKCTPPAPPVSTNCLAAPAGLVSWWPGEVTLAQPGTESTQILSFDTLPATSPGYEWAAIPDGYGGMNWDNFSVLNGLDRPPTEGYYPGVVSPANVAFPGYGDPASVSRTAPFTLVSAQLTAAFSEDLSVIVEGWHGETAVFSNLCALTRTGPRRFEFSNNPVTRVTFTPTIPSGWFALDDLMIGEPRVALDPRGGNPGSLMNGVALVPGVVGDAFRFDGTDDFVRIPRRANLDPGSQVTIEFWMKADPTNTLDTYQGLVTSDFWGVEIANGYALGPLGVNFFLSTDGGATVGPESYPDTATINGGGAVVSAGAWHHIAATYDGEQLQLYIDGQPWGLPQPHTGAISPMRTNSFVALGAEDGRTICPDCIGSRYFNGLIDEPAIYNRALSAAEILALYRADSSGKCPDTTPSLAPHLLVKPMSTGGFELRFTGVTGRTYSVAASTNLVYWEIIGAAIPAGAGEFKFVDANVGNFSSRFYRVTTP